MSSWKIENLNLDDAKLYVATFHPFTRRTQTIPLTPNQLREHLANTLPTVGFTVREATAAEISESADYAHAKANARASERDEIAKAARKAAAAELEELDEDAAHDADLRDDLNADHRAARAAGLVA